MNSLIGSHPLDYGPDGAFRRNQAKSCDLFVNRSTIRQFHAEFMSRTRRAFRRLMLCTRSGLNPPPPSRAPPLFSAKRRLFSPVKRQSPIFLAHALLLCRCRRSCDMAIGRALGGGSCPLRTAQRCRDPYVFGRPGMEGGIRTVSHFAQG